MITSILRRKALRCAAAWPAARQYATIEAAAVGSESSIIGAYTPVTKRLWEQRCLWDEQALANAKPQAVLIPKPPVESEVEFRFKSDPVLREHYRNPWSGVRIGRVLEDMDSLAGFVSYQHCDDADPTTRPPVLVTATVEAIRMNQAGLTLNEDMKMTGRVIWTGRSSLDIQLEVKQAGKTAITALFTFVARQALGGGSQAINPVVPQTEEDKKLYAQRQATADARKAARAAEAEHLNWTSEQAAWIADLLRQSTTKRDLPALAAPHTLLMSETSLANTFTTQPQQRNLHGRIFGGFLMRRAFELAHATAYMLSACRPHVVMVDEIKFIRPVDIGDLVRYKSWVLKTWPLESDPTKGVVHVEIEASVIKPESLQSFDTNAFSFLFVIDRRKDAEGRHLPLTCVLPVTEEQAERVCIFYGPGSKRQAYWHIS